MSALICADFSGNLPITAELCIGTIEISGETSAERSIVLIQTYAEISISKIPPELGIISIQTSVEISISKIPPDFFHVEFD